MELYESTVLPDGFVQTKTVKNYPWFIYMQEFPHLYDLAYEYSALDTLVENVTGMTPMRVLLASFREWMDQNLNGDIVFEKYRLFFTDSDDTLIFKMAWG